MFETKKIKALVVDDDPDVLRTLAKILKRKGQDVHPFESPVAALEYLKREKVDIILTDLKMPEMDGIQFLYQAKALCPRVPVILITGYAAIDTAVSAIKLGAFDYLRKPFEIKKIYEVIDRALSAG